MSPRHRAGWAGLASVLLHAVLLWAWPRTPAPTPWMGTSDLIAPPAITAFLVPADAAAAPHSRTTAPDTPRAVVPSPSASHRRAVPSLPAPLPPSAPVPVQTPAQSPASATPPGLADTSASTAAPPSALNMQLPPPRAWASPSGRMATPPRPGPVDPGQLALPSLRSPTPPATMDRPPTTTLTETRGNQGSLRAEVVTPTSRYCLRARASSRLHELRDSPTFDRAINPTNCP